MRIVAGILIWLLIVAGAVGYKYYSDMKAWQQVEQSVIRLSAGMKYEPVITFRSKLADSDAAIKTFESAKRLFPLGHKERLESVKKGIQYIDITIEEAKGVEGWADMAANYSELTRFMRRVCDKNALFFSRPYAQKAFGFGGSYLIREFVHEVSDDERREWKEGFFPALDLAKEEANCEEQYREARQKEAEVQKVAAAQHQAKWKYHVVLYNTQSCTVTAYADGAKVPLSSFEPRLHLDANSAAGLYDVWCSKGEPGHVVKVKINGAEYSPLWERQGEHSFGQTTRLVPPR